MSESESGVERENELNIIQSTVIECKLNKN